MFLGQLTPFAHVIPKHKKSKNTHAHGTQATIKTLTLVMLCFNNYKKYCDLCIKIRLSGAPPNLRMLDLIPLQLRNITCLDCGLQSLGFQ